MVSIGGFVTEALNGSVGAVEVGIDCRRLVEAAGIAADDEEDALSGTFVSCGGLISPLRHEENHTPTRAAVEASALVAADICDLAVGGSNPGDIKEVLDLEKALREAREALDAARQYVTSPLLEEALCAPSESVEESEAGTQCPIESPAAVLSQQAAPSGSIADDALVGDAQPWTGGPGGTPSREHMNMMHIRFGESAARARVEQARNRERSAQAMREAEDKERLAEQEARLAKCEALRRRCAQRAMSERRAKKLNQMDAESARARDEAARAAEKAAADRYARSAARRAMSEKSRMQSLESDVLRNLQEMQEKRREEGIQKGLELQRKCEKADFKHCQSVVGAKRRLASRRNTVGKCASGENMLPQIPQTPRRGVSADGFRQTAPQRKVTDGNLRLPPLVP
eukprot:TRINITY_DN51288_c0_g1_i1.p1 TRINITY_DN51288_c0_g1~~TRINITY_DN51288_c0_g1_i1.p1  ORF type:complete len:401 (+),score=78.75 TRINITY_DN51288_c0_g1_i1:183-1385(+)